MDHLSIPSCYKYIKTKEGEADYQRIYGVAVSAYQTKYPDAPIIKEEIFRYLQLSQVIPEKYNPELLNMDYVETLFFDNITISMQFDLSDMPVFYTLS